MNKKEFMRELQNKLNCDKDKAIIINSILEDNFFLSKKNTPKIINELIDNLKISKQEAANIFEVSKSIIKNELRQKILYPFRNK